MTAMQLLADIRKHAGTRETEGLADALLEQWLKKDENLAQAIHEAADKHAALRKTFGDVLKLPEGEAIRQLQEDFVNFYPEDQVNPYIALAARGPWIVTAHGAVLHDNGGYGMLGLGHGPRNVLAALGENHVIANIMTPSFSQARFTKKLFEHIGFNRPEGKRRPYAKFLCMNSGSEAMTVATRISDLHAKSMTDPGGQHAGKATRFLALKGSFHGRTERPAQASDSTRSKYQALNTYRNAAFLITVTPNDVAGLEKAFADAEKDGLFIECMFLEPVMGEGDPGKATTPEFYKKARELTKKMGTLLLVDSIQAGLRTQGCLSIMDYPGFENMDAPDMETYSKAINAGQYPLSVLAMRDDTAKIYVRGVYGNTMTANPRALEVACAVLDDITPALRKNVVDQGQAFIKHFNRLKEEFPGIVTAVQGTGLLCSLGLKEEGYKVIGRNGIETWLRKHGIGVIHGGKNALRFTPHFRITTEEVELVIAKVREALARGPVYK